MAGTNTKQKRQRTLRSKSLSSNEKDKLTATLVDLDVLNCSICFDTLTIPINQCENGHVACLPCCVTLNNKCGTCSLPTLFRNRAMGRILEQLIAPCPNAEFGCSEDVSYDKRLTHVFQCAFTPCHCPFTNCDFTGSYKDLYKHSLAEHRKSLEMFKCESQVLMQAIRTGERVVLKEHIPRGKEGYGGDVVVLEEHIPSGVKEGYGGELVVMECFNVPHGHIISVSCIAPNVPGIGEFYYHLEVQAFLDGEHCLSNFRSKVQRVHKVSGEPPDKHFVLIPSFMCPDYKMSISLNRTRFRTI